jgi:hypothetical protein
VKKSEFNKLKALWYKKLERSGFKDIEQDEVYFKNSNVSVIDQRRVTWQSQAEYYQMATDFLNVHPFKSRVERIIWEYHANGISTRDIADILNKVRKNKILRMTVWRIVKRLEIIMKKMYLVGHNE